MGRLHRRARTAWAWPAGLDALWISFRLLGVGVGDEVIVCSNAYIACVMGISMNGARPVFVEPDEYDNIDAEKIEAAVTPRTKAILAVHLFGQACDMDRVMEIARRYGLRVVEDLCPEPRQPLARQNGGHFWDSGLLFLFTPPRAAALWRRGLHVTDDADWREVPGVPELRRRAALPQPDGGHKLAPGRIAGRGCCGSSCAIWTSSTPSAGPLRPVIPRELENPQGAPAQGAPRRRLHLAPVCSARGRAGQAGRLLKERGIGTIIHYPIPPHLSQAYAYLGKKPGDYPHCRAVRGRGAEPAHVQRGMTAAEQGAVIDAINSWGAVRCTIKTTTRYACCALAIWATSGGSLIVVEGGGDVPL